MVFNEVQLICKEMAHRYSKPNASPSTLLHLPGRNCEAVPLLLPPWIGIGVLDINVTLGLYCAA